MTYGIFNLASGNLVDAVGSEPEALDLLTVLLEDRDANPEEIGLIVAGDDGRTILSLQGHSLTDAVYHGGISAAVYA